MVSLGALNIVRNYSAERKIPEKENVSGFSLAGIIAVSTLFVAVTLGVLIYFDRHSSC
jgi:small basic protein